MQSAPGSERKKSVPSAPCALWPVDLKLTHVDWSPEAALIHFQGQYLTVCDLDYKILHGEVQSRAKTKVDAVDIGEFCLVEDLTSGRWYRGRVQNRNQDLFDVFLIDHGNILSVDVAHISSCSNDLFSLPPKIVCGFLANVLLLQGCPHSVIEAYFSNLIGRNVTGYIQALLPYKVLLLEAPDINIDLVRHGFGRHVDTDTFLLLVEMLTEVPLKQNIEPVPDLLIEKPLRQEFFFKPSGLQGYKDILSLCGPRLSCGTRTKVRITAAVNPGLFYCQMINMETDLWEMSKKLTAVNECKNQKGSQETPENLGLLCSIKGKDGKWYRGFVQYLPVNSQLRVLFIDYGFFESVKVENVHRLPPDLYSTPIMAIPCSLSSLSDQDEVVKTQQLDFLKAGLLGRILDVEMINFDEDQHLYSISVIGVEDDRMKEPESNQEHPTMKAESVFEAEELSPQCSYLNHEIIVGDTLSKTLEAEEVHVGSVFVGYVEHVQNPSHFWMRTQKRNDEFEEIMNKIAENFSQVKLDEDVLVNPELGTLCCALYEQDLHFYRGVVTDKLVHGSEVLFIDFGNTEKVPHMLIKKIPEAFACKSAFAFCCTLVNIFPLDEVWTSTASDFFRKAVLHKALQVQVVQIRKNKFVVDLHDMESDNKQSISELMTASQQAAYWNNFTIEPVVQSNADLTSDINGNTEQGKDCDDEEKACKNQNNKAPTPASFKALNIKPGCNLAVCCSYMNSPSDFWCQPLDKHPALEELMDHVQHYYSTHTVPLQSGDLCCVAKSPQDGRWYRAFITEKQNDHATVMLVDYGLTIQVREDSLQAIIPEYVCLERQAFRCSLYNLIELADPKSDWSPEVCKWLEDLKFDSTSGLRCEVVSQFNVKQEGQFNVVKLFNTQTQQSITNMLLKQGQDTREATISAKQLSTAVPESFVYSSYDLSPGNEEQVFVTHVGSQWEVYCHLERNTEITEDLDKQISVESLKMMEASTREVVRKLFLAKYLDGNWYRGLAHPVQSPLHLSVFFVDYGNTSICEKTQVMSIPRDCADLLYAPMQAVKFHLASVPKEELHADVKEWLDGAILNKQVKAVIAGKNEDGSFDVELYDGDVNINEKLKELIQSLLPKPKTVVSFDKSSTQTKCKTLHTPKARTSVKCNSKSKAHFPTSSAYRCTQVGSVPHKKKKKKKSYVHGEAQNKNTTVKQRVYHANLQSAQPQHTEEMEVPRLSYLPDMKVSAGFRAQCFVSHINSVTSFFLQLSEDESVILKMCEDLNSSVLRDSLKAATSLRINDVVLSEYEEDGALYRSAVRNCEGNSSFKVEFVDYGNSAVMGKEKIYSIPKEYLSQPRLSISCSLLDTNSYESDASFTDAVMEKPLMVEFVRYHEGHWEVKVEILEAAALEAAVESRTDTQKEEEWPTDSFEDKASSCEQNDHTNSETTVDGENLMLKPTSAILSPKPEEHERAPTKTKCDSEENWTFILSHSPTLEAKPTESGTVLSVLSNGIFYTRLSKTSELLNALVCSIADNLYKCEMVAEEDVKQGLSCLVQVDEDPEWHRAVVQDVGWEKCQVFLVDHGVTKEIPTVSIRRLSSELTETPHLAVLCKVNCLGFSEGDGGHELWETLKLMIGTEVKLMFVCYSEADKLWNVEIVMSGPSIVPQVTTSLPACTTQNKKAEAAFSLDSTPPQQLAFAPISIGETYSGCAAAVTTPFEFCVVLEDLLLVMNQVSLMLDDVLGQMVPLPEAHLVPGTCVLLKSDLKKKWCRAEIVHADTSVVLNLVDYGHYECIPYEDRTNLRRLPEKILSLPKVTYPCALRGVKPAGADGQWTDEAAVFFQQCLYQKNLQIFFRELVSNTHWKVDVLADGVHVAKELVDAGHASYIDISLGLRFQEQSSSTGAPRSPEGEEESADEAKGKMPFSDVSGPHSCLLM